ncbi:AfsR/SARP family transcriptional regulator [Spongiactinospora rosea]|uniref:AfsR/SARP family transcriptional regulator n=1 Tax=Spongiactinospora rosea TaxID=2248750 RepID=A0A366LQD5_9ACTN|nr:AfsR/SARP family transcriptional regulator [Spongiactinospora rosea]
MLVRLALDPGRMVATDELAAALWGAASPVDPANALQTLVSRLRRALGRPHGVESVPGGYRLDVPREAVDAHRFERLAAEGRRALEAGDPHTATRVLGQALALWRGQALADVADAPFAIGTAVRLEEARLTATEDHYAARIAAGEVAPAVAGLRELAARHPRRERVRGLLMRALAATGQRAEALAGYAEFSRELAEELGVDPGPELREIHLELLRAEPPAAPRRRGNLRTPLTSFVGRTTEIERITAQFKESRLVTLVGPGGAGKTRLATTVAADLPRGAWLVELASVADGGDVPAAVLAALGNPTFPNGGQAAKAGGPRDTMGGLFEALSSAETTLVLDNCEHVIDAAAHLAEELLGHCPRLRVLATSREPLGILGEALCPVPPLPLPEPGEPAGHSPAVRLFADRVAAVRPGFALDERTTAMAVEICRRLDGLPLAIELAAARMRSLTAEQVAARLDDRFRLLGGGSRTALPRHQTLRAVVAWSWDLLGDDERALAERLAVFPAGATLDAIEHVGGTLDLLSALVDKSLVQVAEGPRYRMLETIREYGQALLAERGELAGLRAAHAAYYLRLAETAEPYVRSGAQRPWVARLDAEHDNMLAALHWAAEAGDAATAVRLAAALGMYWTIRGDGTATTARIREALAVPGESPRRARLVITGIYLVSQILSNGVEDMQEVTGLLRRIADEADAEATDDPMLILLRPLFALFTDDTELGMRVVGSRIAHPDPWVRGSLLSLRAALLENEGRMAECRDDLVASVAALRESGERWALSMALTSLAETHSVFGAFPEAIAALEEAIRLTRELVPHADAGHQRVWLAGTRLRQGDVERARAELEAIAAPGNDETSPRNVAFALLDLGDLARHDGDLAAAERAYAESHRLLTGAPFVAPQFHALLRTAMGQLAVARGDPGTALAEAGKAFEYAMSARDMPVVARIAVLVAGATAARGDPRRAAGMLGASEQIRGAPDLFHLDVARITGRLSTELGRAAYDAAYAEGRALSREAALALVQGV